MGRGRSGVTAGIAWIRAVLLLLCVSASGAWAAPPALFPLDQVRPGMKGIGRTVFHGDSIEEFGVEIVAVIHNSRPQGDLILFRGQGPLLEHIGIAQGMSGSPVYIDGRLVGAVAFTYSLSKDPIGGITPIAEMLSLLKSGPSRLDQGEAVGGSRARDAGPQSTREAGSLAVDPAPEGEGGASAEAFAHAWATFLSLGRGASSTVETDRPASEGVAGLDAAGGGVERLALPISLSGWADALRPEIERRLQTLGFACAAGGGGDAPAAGEKDPAGTEPAHPLEPGAAVGVSLIRGDANIAAIGTLTYVDGKTFVAFGHPLNQAGSVSYPLCGAWIHTLMPNLDISYKMGSPTRLLGRIWEDQRSGVAGSFGQEADLLPIRITVNSAEAGTRRFSYQVIRDLRMTPVYLPWTVSNSFLASGWGQGQTAVRSEVTVYFDGGRTVKRMDRQTGDALAASLGLELTLPALLVLINPFERARIDSISVALEAERRNVQAHITKIQVWPRHLAVNDTLSVRVTLEPYRAPAETRLLSVVVPGGWAGKRILVAATGTADLMDWDKDRAPEKYVVKSLTQLCQYIEEVPSDGSMILRFVSREEGRLVEGLEIADVPPSLSAAGTARGARAVMRGTSDSILKEEKLDTPWVVRGHEAMEVEVTQ